MPLLNSFKSLKSLTNLQDPCQLGHYELVLIFVNHPREGESPKMTRTITRHHWQQLTEDEALFYILFMHLILPLTFFPPYSSEELNNLPEVTHTKCRWQNLNPGLLPVVSRFRARGRRTGVRHRGLVIFSSSALQSV